MIIQTLEKQLGILTKKNIYTVCHIQLDILQSAQIEFDSSEANKIGTYLAIHKHTNKVNKRC